MSYHCLMSSKTNTPGTTPNERNGRKIVAAAHFASQKISTSARRLIEAFGKRGGDDAITLVRETARFQYDTIAAANRCFRELVVRFGPEPTFE